MGTASPASPRAAVQLTLLVVDDPQMALAASRLAGEWAERSGGELLIQEMTLDKLLSAQEIVADAIVYPSRHVGTLVSRQWLRPVRDSVLRREDFALGDLLPLVRNESMRYAGKIYGVSLGESPLLFAWQTPNKESLVPLVKTWENLDQLSPLAAVESELAAELIVRAVSSVDRQYRAELLFDAQTMTPRLTEPPIIRALQHMVARFSQSTNESLQVRITWPSAEGLASDSLWRFSALPRTGSVFDALRERWQPRATGSPLTVLGFAGRTLSVTRGSRNASSAFKLLAWLTTDEVATQLSSRSHATVWFRGSQRRQAKRWLGGRGGDELVGLVTQQLTSESFYLLPRIPGIDRYLDSLEKAIVQAVGGERSPVEALEAAADQWEALTETLGQEKQRRAYRWHLGLAEADD